MRLLIVIAVAAAAACGCSPERDAQLSPADAKMLIPEAASMPVADFEKLTSDPEANPAKLDSQTLSLILLSLNPSAIAKDRPAAAADFRYLGEAMPKPSVVAAAMAKSKSKGYATIIQPEFITDCTCSAKDGTATGSVSFTAERLYAGKAEFLARRKDGAWSVDEFRLPGYGIRTLRGPDGKWRKSKLPSKAE